METVVAFNNELSGLYDSRPPISKAKMAAITKSAMRAIKFYKHVVQSVEKFILKCKSEYKVPGLYVIDSIVRQSRHQYGTEKDVFAPRFQRNLPETFANLFRCAPEDKSRIIRVLNLWQKNNVFKSEVIQPIFDLADPNHPIYHQMMAANNAGAGPSGSGGGHNMSDISGGNAANGLNASGLSNLDLSAAEDKMGGAMPDLSLSHEKCSSSSRRHMEQHYMKRSHQHNISMSMSASSSKRESRFENSNSSKSHHHKYSKSTHDLDYDMRDFIDEDDGDMGDDHHFMGDDSPPGSTNLLDNNNLKQLLNDPNVLRQLQTLQNFQKFKQEENQKLRYQDDALQQHLQNVLKGTAGMPPGMVMNMHNDGTDMNKDVEFISEQQPIEVINLDGNDSRSPTPDRDRYKRSRRSSRSRSPRNRGGGGGGANDRDRGRRRNSRSRSRSPRSSRRRGSRDRDRMERSNRDKERDREHERERRKKGLPEIKKEQLSVCSTTLWVGHLSKLVCQEELSDTFGEYGDIVSIDQIVPRGCAFIVMNRRQDAHKAMQSLKNHKLQGRAITISWAAGKGVKSKEWKDFWDLELGVTYVPWNKLSVDTDLDSLEEGGMFDEDTMPSWMKQKINQGKNVKDNKAHTTDMSTAPPVAPPSLLFGIDTTQPPPVAPQAHGAPPAALIRGQFPMGPPPPLMGQYPGQFPNHPMGGVGMPPNMVPGMPPPMMMPTNMMPGFPGMAAPPPHPMGLPPGAQFPPPGSVPPPMSAAGPAASNVSDDQMDIEMELEDAAPAVPAPQQQPPNFNQPPPIFGAGPANNVDAAVAVTGNELHFQRERPRGPSGAGSRWSSRDDVAEAAERWRNENGGGGGPPAIGGGFNEARARLNLNTMDQGNMPPRPDFMGGIDFDNRGPRGMGPGPRNHNGSGAGGGDFFQPNMNQNRFNQPTSLMQMRIPPPVAFNQRMGGPSGAGNGVSPMFMRNQGGGNGGRQQGPGFFNTRNPFNDGQRNRSGGRGLGRSGRWSDDEDDNGKNINNNNNNNNNFKRGPTNRNARGGRGGQRSEERERVGNNRRGSRDESSRNSISSTDENAAAKPAEAIKEAPVAAKSEQVAEVSTNAKSSPIATEEDWDRELQEYDARMEAQRAAELAAAEAKTVPEAKAVAVAEVEAERETDTDIFAKPAVQDTAATFKPKAASPVCTPLYDELPPPSAPKQAQPEERSQSPSPPPPKSRSPMPTIEEPAIASPSPEAAPMDNSAHAEAQKIDADDEQHESADASQT
ncbi:SR-related and CTD-associated factor 4 isoform X3 [Drosophila busckii]|uniref:SR-related and CTD-associated factor 4 isoform X3 n=1 Tax=Drosophila busckii TaxID=30019 RepID=UPI00083ED765|nr:SR-related and CTD-associated factor 4 isoform X3 [Drosophila busckii]